MELHSVICLLLVLVTVLPSHSFDPPAVIETNSLQAFVGSCVEIRCKVTGDLVHEEDALVLWIKDRNWDNHHTGTIVYSSDPTEHPVSPEFEGRVTYTGSTRLFNRASSSNNPSCSVSICGLTEQDSGNYTFRYISKQQESYKWSTRTKAHIEVTDPCEITFYKPTAVREGQTITLSCFAPSSCFSSLKIESVPPSLKNLTTYQYWVSYTARAEFTTSWTDDGAEFTCQTENNKDPQRIKKITVTVQYAPRETVAEINSDDIEEGQSVTLSCSAKGQPPPIYTWYRKNQWSYRQHTVPVWEINPVQSQHSGQYFCYAQNNHGSQWSDLLQIDVKYGPSVEVRASQQPPYKQGQTLTLSCHVLRSNPSPSTFTWFKNNHSVSRGQNFSKTLQPEDSGSYSCSAQNSVSTAKSPPLLIQVQYGPKQALVLTAEEEQGPDGSSSVTLSCSSHSFPDSRYTWYRSSEGQTSKVSENRNYTVASTQPGVYYCTAKNEVSESKSQPVSLFLPGNSLKFIVLALVPLIIIIVCVFIVYRLRRKKSAKESCI